MLAKVFKPDLQQLNVMCPGWAAGKESRPGETHANSQQHAQARFLQVMCLKEGRWLIRDWIHGLPGH